MKIYKININNFIIAFMLVSFLSAEIGLSGGINYGGITYDEEISRHISIANEIGFNVNLEKSIGPTLVAIGYLQQNYTENFNSQDYENSTFKNSVTANYITGYVIYPYEIWKFRFWGGIQLGKALNASMIKTEDSINTETNLESSSYNLDFGFLIGSDFMITKIIGSRFSYYYGISRVLKENINLNIDSDNNFNIMNVGLNAQLLLRF